MKKSIKLNGRNIKKVTLISIIMIMTVVLLTTTAYATGNVSTSDFITKTGTVLKALVTLIGAGLAVWGVVNLIEGYGNDNPGAKSQGMKQGMAGLALIIVAVVLVPVLTNMMSAAV